MIDTNVIISAILFPGSLPDRALEKVLMEHHLILCSHIIDELHRVFEKKFNNKLLQLEKFLSELSFELVHTPLKIENKNYPEIRDKADLPILVSAIVEDVDIIVTGDKDFFDLNIAKPDIMEPKEFLEQY
jgi:putative PIN family toxin of toxin-antitoxin system